MDGHSERWGVAGATGAVAGIALYVGFRGAGVGAWGAGLGALAMVAAAVAWGAPRLPAWLDGWARRRPALAVAWALVALLAVVQTVRQGVYMVDPQRTEASVLPGDAWTVEHCCLTAYAESARLATAGEPNLYEPRHYRPDPAAPRRIDGFTVDAYHYPPPFLLLPMAARAVAGGDFLRVRALWFGASALALLLALGAVASRVSPEAQRRAVALAPVVWLSGPVQFGLQVSNAQVLVVALAMLAWASLRQWPVAGAGLLAATVVSKLFPGILGVWLLVQRRWREAAWAAAIGGVLIVATWALVGGDPYRAFLGYQMPRLSSGEAFGMLRRSPEAVARNLSPFGIPLKLGRLGVPGMGFDIARGAGALYQLAVVALAVWAARRPARSADDEAAVWLALLSLATLASPFAPVLYVLTSLVWLVTADRWLARPGVVAVVWAAATLPMLLVAREADFGMQVLAFLPAQIVALAVPVAVLVRAARSAPAAPASEPAP